MWNPNYASRVSRFATTGLCVNSERALWRFTYTQTGSLGSVDLIVRGAQITHIFWNFTPDMVASQVASNRQSEIIAASRPSFGGGEAAIAVLGAGAAAIVIFMRRGRDGDAGYRRVGRSEHLLCALREARVAHSVRGSGTNPSVGDSVGLAER
jgi:hypothetical protein